jgi:hypothetical protein
LRRLAPQKAAEHQACDPREDDERRDRSDREPRLHRGRSFCACERSAHGEPELSKSPVLSKSPELSGGAVGAGLGVGVLRGRTGGT